MDYPLFVSLKETSDASLFCAATLHRYDLPHDYARLENYTLSETCHCCQAPLWNPDLSIFRSDRIFVWQCHMCRCGGDGRRLQAHEAVKLAIKRLVLSCPDPEGCAFPSAYVLIEPRHLRQDNSHQGDTLVMGNGMRRKDSVMDVVVTSWMQKSCLLQSVTSSDYAIKKA